MTFFRVKADDGTLYIPAGDVQSVLVKADGSGVVRFKAGTGLDPVVVKNGADVVATLQGFPDTNRPAPSLFEAIFGKP